MNVLRTRVGRVYRPRVGTSMPPVDSRGELNPRVGAFPRRLRYLPPQIPGPHPPHRLPRRPSRQLPRPVGFHRPHKLIGNPHRVVGVLEPDGHIVQTRPEPGRGQRPRFPFLLRFAPRELVNIRMIRVQTDHLRRPPGLPPRLDRPRRRVRPGHKRNRPRSHPAAGKQLHRPPHPRQIHPRTRTAPENPPLHPRPVQNALQIVVHGQNETRRHLIRRPLHPQIEPHRRVESRPLADQQSRQLIGEQTTLLLRQKVAILPAPPGDSRHHPAHQPGHVPLPARRPHRPPEILLRHDIRRRRRPTHRATHPQLLKHHLPGSGLNPHIPRSPLPRRLQRIPPLGGKTPPGEQPPLLRRRVRLLSNYSSHPSFPSR